MIVNPSITKPKGIADSITTTTRGSQAKQQQRRYTRPEISCSAEREGNSVGSSFRCPPARMSPRRSSIDSTFEKLEEEIGSSTNHCQPTCVAQVVSQRRFSIHIGPETNNDEDFRSIEGQEGATSTSRVVRRRSSSIHISPEKAEEIRICVEGNSSLSRERLEERRARLDQEQKLLASKRKSLIERWEKETIQDLQIEVYQNETKGFREVQRILSKVGEKGGESMADRRQALSRLQSARPNRLTAPLVA